MVSEGGELLTPDAPLKRLVLAAAAAKYPNSMVRLEPDPVRKGEPQVGYTVAIKARGLDRAFVVCGPHALDWETVARGTLPELLKQMES
jgi:hypothetical protein